MLHASSSEYGSIIHFTHRLHPAAENEAGKCFVEDVRTISSNAIGLGIPCRRGSRAAEEISPTRC